MKNLILALCFLVSSSVFAGISLVSDLDDTIKITAAGGNPADILRTKVYAGMPEFFAAASSYSDSLSVVTGSPSLIKLNVEALLRRHKITYQGLFLRKKITEDIEVFKLRTIRKIMESSADDFIFFGDDYDRDPKIYARIAQEYPGRVLAIYIHSVKGRPVTEDVVLYYTSFDLVMREYMAGRLGAGYAEDQFKKLASEDMELIFPKKASCPTDSAVWEWQLRSMYVPEALALITRFTTFCKARQSDIFLQ